MKSDSALFYIQSFHWKDALSPSASQINGLNSPVTIPSALGTDVLFAHIITIPQIIVTAILAVHSGAGFSAVHMPERPVSELTVDLFHDFFHGHCLRSFCFLCCFVFCFKSRGNTKDTYKIIKDYCLGNIYL